MARFTPKIVNIRDPRLELISVLYCNPRVYKGDLAQSSKAAVSPQPPSSSSSRWAAACILRLLVGPGMSLMSGISDIYAAGAVPTNYWLLVYYL